MTTSTLKRFVLAPIVISAGVFAALTLPLAAFGSKPVTIQFQEEPVFSGQLRDVATPYLGLATLLSLGAGLASVAVTGWQQSTRKSSQVEEKLDSLAQILKEKEAQLENLLLSESRISASGLDGFLDEDAPLIPPKKTEDVSPEIQAVVAEPITPQPMATQPGLPSQPTVQSAVAHFPSAQAFLGLQGYPAAQPSAQPQPVSNTSQEVEQLQRQIQQIMAQMVFLQDAIQNPNSSLVEKSGAHAHSNAHKLYVVQTGLASHNNSNVS